MTIPVLDIANLTLSFGGLTAVDDFSLTLHDGALHGLIGPNGAGKTTVFNLLTGVYEPDQGIMRLGGKPLNRLDPHEIAAAGVARTFQNIRLFGELSVLDNVKIACHLRSSSGGLGAVLRLPKHVAYERAMTERAEQLLELFDLHERRSEQAKNLPYGDQRCLEIARALATEPVLLLLDEPAAGMNTQEKADLSDLIEKVRSDFSVTILLIEHDMTLVMDICERITVLDHGRTIAVGTPAEVQRDPHVIEAYLGEPGDAAFAERSEEEE